MIGKLSLIAAVGILAAFTCFEAQAMPAAPLQQGEAADIVKVAGGCGPGWHRGPYGGCRRNWGPVGRRCWFQPTPYGPRRVCRW